MKTKLVAVIALIFCAFMAEASKITIARSNWVEISNIPAIIFGEIEATRNSRYSNIRMDEALP